ncbi:YqeG family HAD IIIA-type phosphatase [bacterium]|nr:YqeG family HAD IIIA-type phosphatase [bacterium]
MIYFSQRRLLRSLLTPNLVCRSLFDIPLESLSHSGYNAIWLDVDNTLLGAEDRDVSLNTQNWVLAAKSLGYSVVILSNNRRHYRIERICNQVDVDGVFRAMKPFPHSIRKVARQRQISLRRSIVVGDQLLTDVIVGNWVRAYSVLVDPMDKKLSLFKTVQREIELFFLARLQ